MIPGSPVFAGNYVNYLVKRLIEANLSPLISVFILILSTGSPSELAEILKWLTCKFWSDQIVKVRI